MSQEPPVKEHPQDVKAYLARLYAEERRQHACRAQSPEEFVEWQAEGRKALYSLLCIPRIAADAGNHVPQVEIFDDDEDMGSYTRYRGCVEPEPDVHIPFWLLKPKQGKRFPLAVTPHGHENGDTYVGIGDNEHSRLQIEQQDQNVAVQAVERGFLTIAPAARALGSNPANYRIADIGDRHGGRDCTCHNWQVMIVGRTMLGERVWDLMKILDWALTLDEVDADRVLMTGNSGGGMATAHTAACDERITVAVPCCAYNNYISPQGTLRHCPCNTVPGLLDFGEYWDVAGLIAPRHLLTVNGRHDGLHPVDEVDHAVSRLKTVYEAGGASERYEHRYGDAGHRFYAHLMWPWIEQIIGKR